MTINQKPEIENQKPGHLGYLLSAYLFDSVSAAGRREVETHLQTCAECRAQLELLRETLGAAEKALDPGGKEYVFEERRRVRVMEAAYRSSKNPRIDTTLSRNGEMRRFSVKRSLVAVAALLMVMAVVGAIVTPSLLRSRMASNQPEAAAATKAFDEAEEIFRRPDYDADGVREYKIDLAGGSELTPAKPASPAQTPPASDPVWNESTQKQFVQGTISKVKEKTGAYELETSGLDTTKITKELLELQEHGVRPPAQISEVVRKRIDRSPPKPSEAIPAPGKELGLAVDDGWGIVVPAEKKEMAGKVADARVTAPEPLVPRESRLSAEPPPPPPVAPPVAAFGRGVVPVVPDPLADQTQKEIKQVADEYSRMKMSVVAERDNGLNNAKEALSVKSGEVSVDLGGKADAKPNDSITILSGAWAAPQTATITTSPVGGENIVLNYYGVVAGAQFANTPPPASSYAYSAAPQLDMNGRGEQNAPVVIAKPKSNADATRQFVQGRLGGARSESARVPGGTDATSKDVRTPSSNAYELTIGDGSHKTRDKVIIRQQELDAPKPPAITAGPDKRLDAHKIEYYLETERVPNDAITALAVEQKKRVDEKGRVVPREILDKAQLGDRLETLDQPGNSDASMLHRVKGSENAAGGGGKDSGVSLKDIVGVGGVASPGTGGNPGVELQIYDIRDLKTSVADFPGPRIDIGVAPGAPTISPADLQVLIKEKLLTAEFADPATSIEESGGKLIVMQRPEVHDRIRDLLRRGVKDGRALAEDEKRKKRPALESQMRVSINDMESALRGFRHLRAENKELTFQAYLRRPSPVPAPPLTDEGLDEDAYIERHGTRPFVDCARDNLSTFGLDVDTASYTLARARLREGQLPERDAVRVEEFLNYFKQPYAVAGEDAFGVFAEGAPSPFVSSNDFSRSVGSEGFGHAGTTKVVTTNILKIGIKSRDPRANERKPAMLTFVIDTSGSMAKSRTPSPTPPLPREGNNSLTRLDLVQGALRALVAKLKDDDAVSIVGFADQAELVLPRTQARQKHRILDAIDSLTTRGASNVEGGLQMGLRMADETYSAEAVNRVILCSDGVANVGAKGPDEILKLVKVFAGRGVDLCTVGFGMGQYNDQMMMRLADSGNGSCHFVDTLAEAERIFREQLPPNLNVLARDAKAQVEFNPDVVERYRLLGYEKRKIADKDFRNDKIDAGEVAHSTLISVFYEIKRKPNAHGPLGKVFLRWKDAGHAHLPVVERNYPLSEGILAADARSASPNLRFLACVARFAELLRESPWARDGSYSAVLYQLRQLPPEFQARPECQEVFELVSRAQQLTVQKWMKEL